MPIEIDQFKVGDKVEKYTGDYRLLGEVRAVLTTTRGKTRYVVEHAAGFLHIYSEQNLRLIEHRKPNCGTSPAATHWAGCDCHEANWRKNLEEVSGAAVRYSAIAAEANERAEQAERERDEVQAALEALRVEKGRCKVCGGALVYPLNVPKCVVCARIAVIVSERDAALARLCDYSCEAQKRVEELERENKLLRTGENAFKKRTEKSERERDEARAACHQHELTAAETMLIEQQDDLTFQRIKAEMEALRELENGIRNIKSVDGLAIISGALARLDEVRHG